MGTPRPGRRVLLARGVARPGLHQGSHQSRVRSLAARSAWRGNLRDARGRDLAPDSFEAQLNLGTLLVESGDLSEAEACVRDALRLRPGAESATRLAVVLTRQGKF